MLFSRLHLYASRSTHRRGLQHHVTDADGSNVRLDSDSMSDLQKTFARAKLAGLPLEPPLPPNILLEEENEDEGEEVNGIQQLPESEPDEDSSSASSASSAASTGTIKPNSKHLFAQPIGFVSFLLYGSTRYLNICNYLSSCKLL